MVFDIPHMIAVGAIVLVAQWVLDQTNLLDGKSTGMRVVVRFLVLIVPLLALNIFWPYGG